MGTFTVMAVGLIAAPPPTSVSDPVVTKTAAASFGRRGQVTLSGAPGAPVVRQQLQPVTMYDSDDAMRSVMAGAADDASADHPSIANAAFQF